MSSIHKYKMGTPFQSKAIGMGVILLVSGLVALTLGTIVSIILGLVLVPLGTFLSTAKMEFWIDNDGKRFKSAYNVLGLIIGSWKSTLNYKAATIKFTKLTVKNTVSDNGSLLPLVPTQLVQGFDDSDETWLVHLIDAKNEKIQILNTDKKPALEALIYIIKSNPEIKPYLAHFRADYELRKDELSKGKLTLVTPKPARGKYY